jgi:hypothetical protein
MRFLISNKLEQLILKLEKIIGIIGMQEKLEKDLRRGHVSYFSCYSHSLSHSHSAFAMFIL